MMAPDELCSCGAPAVWFSCRQFRNVCADCSDAERFAPLQITAEQARAAIDWAMKHPIETSTVALDAEAKKRGRK